MLIRWRATSFSSTTIPWPFLLGVDDGTLPFGRALRIKLSPKEATDRFLLSFAISSSFLPSKHAANAEKTTKKNSSDAVLILAMRERQREREFVGFVVGKKVLASGERLEGAGAS
jgi:hypothetical protein